MALIDRVYRTVQDVLNKEQRGYFTPEEFDNFAQLAQNEIFEQYFHDYNYFENAMKAGRTNSEFANLPKHFRERINLLTTTGDLLYTQELPDNLYRLITVATNGIIVEEEEHDMNYYANLSPLAMPTLSRPTFLRFGDSIRLQPTPETALILVNGEMVQDPEQVVAQLTYIRKPAPPKWTYIVVNGTPLFNPAASDFQDIELHPAEEHEIVLKILKYAGIQVGDLNIAQTADNAGQMDNQQEFRV